MIYAGIGSRETPDNVLTKMWEYGYELAELGWTLRSGHARGADMAFERGCISAKGTMEIYLPWSGFNGAPRNNPQYISGNMDERHMNIAANFHPAWHRCTDGAKRLHARNASQILGSNLDTPATMVVCWTKDGLAGGGTGQAIRMAKFYSIPVFDLAIAYDFTRLVRFVESF